MMRHLCVTGLAACGAMLAARGAVPVVGVLEHPQCARTNDWVVRPLFARTDSGWVTLDDESDARRTLAGRTTWTIAVDGRARGSVETLPAARKLANATRDGSLRLAPDQRVPHLSAHAPRFEGWCDAPTARPLVVVMPANVGDPESWKPFVPPAALRARLLPLFRQTVDSAVRCPGGSDTAVHFDFSAGDLVLERGYRNRAGRAIVALKLDPRRYECDGPPGDDWSNHWFVLDDQPRLIGVGLELVDAGDYDGDGASELLFWHSAYNRDGYTLFIDHLARHVDRWWSYH